MKESNAKYSVFLLLMTGAMAFAYVAPAEIKAHAVIGYIVAFAVVAYLKDGVFFGQRVYPWGIEYSKRSHKRPGLFKRKPPKQGKKNYKRK